jgi:AhpD family alkylhydroperoxidase
MNMRRLTPEAYGRMVALDDASGRALDAPLRELVKIRASQVNGCAYCIDMHTKDARAGGETEQRIYALDAWRETPFFSDRERAALALTEAVTLVADDHVPDAVYEHAARHFDEVELAELVWTIIVGNAWNRLAITCRAVPGSYQPAPGAGADAGLG